MAKRYSNFHTSNAFGGYHSSFGNYVPTKGGSSTKAGAPKPAAPAPAPAPTAPPVSLTAGATINAAGSTLADQLARLNQQAQQAGTAFGYNPDGSLNQGTPYGRAQLLDRSFQQQARGNNTAYAAMGQLYSGARLNKQNSTSFNYLANKDALLKQYQDTLSRIAAQRQADQTAATNQTNIARAQAADQGMVI